MSKLSDWPRVGDGPASSCPCAITRRALEPTVPVRALRRSLEIGHSWEYKMDALLTAKAYSGGAERRQNVAHGVSRGFPGAPHSSPGGATENLAQGALLPRCRPCRGLRFVRTSSPRLAPWGYGLPPLRGFSKCRLSVGDTRTRKWPISRLRRGGLELGHLRAGVCSGETIDLSPAFRRRVTGRTQQFPKGPVKDSAPAR